MTKLKKHLLLEEVKEHPLIIRHGPTESHNEVTVAVMDFKLNINVVSRILTRSFLERINRISVSYPSPGIKFHFNGEYSFFVFTCKAKTERRGNDVHDQEFADKIAVAKCKAKAYRIATRIISEMEACVKNDLNSITKAKELFEKITKREEAYIQKV